jgi:FkbM family methyltransferase
MEILPITNEEFYKLFDNKTDVFFVQIGANDGITADPIQKIVKEKNWSGILFEPGKDAFKDLLKNYEGYDNLKFINAAVSNYNGKGKLFCGTTTPHFTLNQNKAIDMFDVTPTEVEVDVVHPKNIILENNITKIDLLQIDVEGHDFTILQAFPYDLVKPEIIRFEFVNLNYDGVGVNEVSTFLSELNYTSYINREGGDIISILNK